MQNAEKKKKLSTFFKKVCVIDWMMIFHAKAIKSLTLIALVASDFYKKMKMIYRRLKFDSSSSSSSINQASIRYHSIKILHYSVLFEASIFGANDTISLYLIRFSGVLH